MKKPKTIRTKLPFEESEFKDRVARVRKSMEKNEIEVLLVTSPTNIYYLTGYSALLYRFRLNVSTSPIPKLVLFNPVTVERPLLVC